MDQFGKYRLVAELGRGGMAEVTLALEQGPVGFNKLVVVKRIRDHLAEDTEFVSMLLDEARLAAKLNHPNIVNTTEVGDVDGVFYMAMDYLDGQPFNRIQRRGRAGPTLLTTEIQARIIADMLTGLDYAHKLADYDGTPLGVVHRDISPSNVFVTYDGVVKVVDFGIAMTAGRVTETKTGIVKGKVTYIAPEQALGDVIDHRADVFSAGVMLWEAAVGERMWPGVDDVAVLSKLISEQWPRSPKERNPDVPEALDWIVRKALAPDPDDRFADAEEFRAAIEDWLESLPKVPSQRAVSRLVSEMFAAERQDIKELIESQLSRIETGAPSMHTIDMAQALGTGPESQTMVSLESSPPPETSISVARDHDLDRARRRSLFGMGLGLIAAGGAMALLIRAGDEPRAPAAGTGTVSAVAPPTASSGPLPPPNLVASASSKVGGLVPVKLRASPRNATFHIDDGPRITNPFEGVRTRDGEIHIVRVEAPGHEPVERKVRFDGPVDLEIALESSTSRSTATPRPRPAPRSERPPEPKPPLVPPGPQPKSNIEIDRSDPWKN